MNKTHKHFDKIIINGFTDGHYDGTHGADYALSVSATPEYKAAYLLGYFEHCLKSAIPIAATGPYARAYEKIGSDLIRLGLIQTTEQTP